ncbi:MAG TPA: hypothetical protein VGM23_04945 [Armatimonadota bacterium]
MWWFKPKYKEVNIYSDVDGKLTFAPTGISKPFNITKELDTTLKLPVPYSDDDLYATLQQALDLCFSKRPTFHQNSSWSEAMHESKRRIKESKGKKLVTFRWSKDDGYIVEATERDKRGAYTVTEEISLGHKPEKSEIVAAIHKAFELSTC